MFAPLLLLIISCGGLLAALVVPSLSDLVLLAGPCVVASLILLLRAIWDGGLLHGTQKPWIILDGSNIMHWKGAGPDIVAVKDTIQLLSAKGFAPGVVFDANVGYKLFDRYHDDAALARLLGLSRDRVMVVAKGTPADEVILAAARDHRARVVTNDRYRDWIERHPEIAVDGYLVRGGYRAGKVWLNLPSDPPR